jgi:hypothetical protein
MKAAPRNHVSGIGRWSASMVGSENGFPLFADHGPLAAHDLIRKPVPTFRDHALAIAAGVAVLTALASRIRRIAG